MNELLEGIHVLRVIERQETTRANVLVGAQRTVVAVVSVGKAGVNPSYLERWSSSHGRHCEREQDNSARLVEEDVDWRIPGLKLGARDLLERLGQLRPH
ncbi:hypothetical protein ACFOLC_16045 [Lysobacter cavernae]|uniref:Uncharacterized protein n=1 Tax=Lysobacter cavernae TaxID=1685901 RepID=A0ABV7RUY3_9GAMM